MGHYQEIKYYQMLKDLKKGDVLIATESSNVGIQGTKWYAEVDRPFLLHSHEGKGIHPIFTASGHCLSNFNEFEIIKKGNVINPNNRPIGKFTKVEKELLHILGPGSKIEGKVKSDGGKSSYYKMPLNERIIEKMEAQKVAGIEPFLEVEDIIEIMVGNDFDFGNITKALRRIFMAKLGGGKEGNDIRYDITKSHYYLDQIENKL